MSTDPLPLVTDLALRLMNLYSRLRLCDAMLSRLGVGGVRQCLPLVEDAVQD